MRLTDATFKGPPNLSKHPQRLSHNSFKTQFIVSFGIAQQILRPRMAYKQI